jgi:protein-L-isoaspartate(D-aspartate) O-methyltransferase
VSLRLEAKKARLLETLVAAGDIRSPAVRAAFETVPRELFVQEDTLRDAYADTPLPIPAGQTISAPSMIAIMLEEAAVARGLRVLEVGAGSGYNAALLAELAGAENVVTVERHPELVDLARTNLRRAGYAVPVVLADGSLGYPPRAPYDRILATAGAPRLPPSWGDQLAAAGRIVAPVGRSTFSQTLLVADKRPDGTLAVREGTPCAFVPLVGADAWRE